MLYTQINGERFYFIFYTSSRDKLKGIEEVEHLIRHKESIKK